MSTRRTREAWRRMKRQDHSKGAASAGFSLRSLIEGDVKAQGFGDGLAAEFEVERRIAGIGQTMAAVERLRAWRRDHPEGRG